MYHHPKRHELAVLMPGKYGLLLFLSLLCGTILCVVSVTWVKLSLYSDQNPWADVHLLRIDVYDSRARFDKLEVLGTPIHELVLLLKVSPAETLWYDSDDFECQPVDREQIQAEDVCDKDLIESGTLLQPR